MNADTFLTEEELVYLTGRKLKRLQIAVLTRMGIYFHINAVGRPIVRWSALENPALVDQKQQPDKWIPEVLKRS